MIKYHIVLKKEQQTEEAVQHVVAVAGLVNLNEHRAKFFAYSVISADGPPEALSILEGLTEYVDSVSLDHQRNALGH